MAVVKGARQWRGWKCKAWMGVGVDPGGGWVGGLLFLEVMICNYKVRSQNTIKYLIKEVITGLRPPRQSHQIY